VRSSCKIGSLFSFEISIVFISVLSIVLLPNTNTPFWAKIRLLTVEEYILEGNQNYHKGEFKKAIEAYEKAIDIKPDEEAYHNMGIAYIMLNEKVSFEDAIKAYEKAIEINPDYDTAYYNMGIAYAKSDKFKEAIEAFKKVIEIKPDFDKAYYSAFMIILITF
jgi:tetratricopeptide (TPR) repeat protein